MAHPQSSFRGLWAKTRIDIGSNQITGDSTGLVLNQGIKISNKANAILTGNSTGLVIAGGVRISNKRNITANSTGFLPSTVTALPGNVEYDGFAFIKNSTGRFGLAINTTGTTWKYVNLTTAFPA